MPSYWLVDPQALELSVLTLVDGAYLESAHLSGKVALSVDTPYPAVLRPFG